MTDSAAFALPMDPPFASTFKAESKVCSGKGRKERTFPNSQFALIGCFRGKQDKDLFDPI